MNKHFKDARYYVGRAGSAAKKGVKTEAAKAKTRINKARGIETEPQPSRVEKVKARLKNAEQRAESKVKSARPVR